MGESPDRWSITKVSDAVRKHHVVTLRPASLFRSVGLTGLSASLPPHRRLRSNIHKSPNASTSLGLSDDLWTGRPGRRFLSDSTVSGGPKHHQPHTNPLHYSTFSELLPVRTQENPLPNITLKKTSVYQASPQRQKSPKTQKEIFINKHSGRLNPTARTHGGDTSPVRLKDTEYFYEEVWRSERQKVRWSRIKRNKRANTDEVPDISQRIKSLEITDTEESHQSRSIGWVEFKPRGRGNRAVSLGKEEEQTRERRPHFLPPITQGDRLLNVPLTLPDNSPPPSPCSPSDVLFFPLSVPHIQPFPLRPETHE